MKGSESGIAGASRTIRHVPEFIRIARKMKALCPNAMIINVTNPLTALTRCVQRYEGFHAMGFCHGILNHLEILLPYFGAKSFDEVSFSVSGVDHCSFLTDVKFHGEDALKIMRDKGMIDAAWAGKTEIHYDDYFAGRENQRIRFILWDMLGWHAWAERRALRRVLLPDHRHPGKPGPVRHALRPDEGPSPVR